MFVKSNRRKRLNYGYFDQVEEQLQTAVRNRALWKITPHERKRDLLLSTTIVPRVFKETDDNFYR